MRLVNGIEQLHVERQVVYQYRLRVTCYGCEKNLEFMVVGGGPDFYDQERHLKDQYGWSRSGGAYFCTKCYFSE